MSSEGLQWARISTSKLTHTVCKTLRERATLLCILPPGALAGFYSEDAGRAKSSCFERCPEHSVLPNKSFLKRNKFTRVSPRASYPGKIKWALESITMNKASGGDGIPVEIFQILKEDAVKVLHSICQQIWKTQQWPQNWKRSLFIPIPKKGNAKECSNYCTTALISHTSKVMLKILQARLQHYVNRELPDVQAGFRKGRGTRDQMANIRGIIEKA